MFEVGRIFRNFFILTIILLRNIAIFAKKKIPSFIVYRFAYTSAGSLKDLKVDRVWRECRK